MVVCRVRIAAAQGAALSVDSLYFLTNQFCERLSV